MKKALVLSAAYIATGELHGQRRALHRPPAAAMKFLDTVNDTPTVGRD